ncbi:MAG: hypothetical protein ACKOB6_01440 [Candidatus Kapaibacterium sp.]
MHDSSSTRILGAVALIASIIWFGTAFSAQVVAYDLFITGTPELRTLDAATHVHTIRIVSNLAAVSAGALLVAFPALVVFLVRRRSQFAVRGYYMMAVALSVAGVPAGIYAAMRGWMLYSMFPDHTQATVEVLPGVMPVFMTMYTTQGWTHFVSEVVYVTIIAVFVLRPLHKSANA